MLACTPGCCDCRCPPARSGALDDDIRPPIVTAARRAYTLLEAVELLTEKPALSEADIIALDVVLESVREHVWEILLLSDGRSGALPAADMSLKI